jgi:hypothetical protein
MRASPQHGSVIYRVGLVPLFTVAMPSNPQCTLALD